jgi:hypothetical protein
MLSGVQFWTSKVNVVMDCKPIAAHAVAAAGTLHLQK